MTYASTILADSPFGYWQLNDVGTTAVDSSGHGNTGTLSGTVATGVAGPSAQIPTAMNFNGGTVTIPASASLTNTVGSVEAWINQTTNNAQGHVVFGSQGEWTLQTNGQFVNAVWFINGGNVITPGSGIAPLGTWYYVASTYQGSAVLLYVNGIQVASVPAVGTDATTQQQTWIATAFGSIAPFLGSIAQVAYYPTVLSLAQIQAHYAAGGFQVPSTSATDLWRQEYGANQGNYDITRYSDVFREIQGPNQPTDDSWKIRLRQRAQRFF